jgi:23S rRNA (guanosine2251-2'-O)-methyltransferase
VPEPIQLAPGEELVAGRRPVEEAFAARRPALRLLVTPGRRQALERLVLHATTLRIPIVEVEGGSLTSLAGFDGHQGIALVVEPRRFATLDEVLARAIERGEPPFVLVLDSLEDPQNLGTVLRSAEAAGVHGVLFPTERQAPLSPAAVKASAGATEHLLLCPVDDLAGALTDLHVRGVRIVGSEADAPLTARQADFRGPLAIVVGSEGHGLSPAVRRRCDLMVRIPMRGAIGSLNAAVAGSVLLFEALGQREPEARPAAPANPTPSTSPDPATAPKRSRASRRVAREPRADEAPGGVSRTHGGTPPEGAAAEAAPPPDDGTSPPDDGTSPPADSTPPPADGTAPSDGNPAPEATATRVDAVLPDEPAPPRRKRRPAGAA